MKSWHLLLLLGCTKPNATESYPVPAPSSSSTTEKPPVIEDSPPSVPPKEHLLAEFTTWFLANPKMDGRVQNILLASSKINDTLIGPGEEFSFNEKVGARTEDSGFKNAPTLFMGEIFPGIGGGTCQVSSTLYATMILTGIEASERRPHSRPSNYISPGFDATVSYPAECLEKSDPTICYDLRFWNPYEFPLHIKTEIGPEMSEKEKQELFDPKRSLKISIFGMGETPKVTTKWASWKTSPFKKRYRRVHYWRDGRMRLKQAGVLGNEGALHVKLTYADGYTVDRKIHSRYQPVSEVWEVGMAWENPEVTVIE